MWVGLGLGCPVCLWKPPRDSSHSSAYRHTGAGRGRSSILICCCCCSVGFPWPLFPGICKVPEFLCGPHHLCRNHQEAQVAECELQGCVWGQQTSESSASKGVSRRARVQGAAFTSPSPTQTVGHLHVAVILPLICKDIIRCHLRLV